MTTADQHALAVVQDTLHVRLDQTRLDLQVKKQSVKNLTLFEGQLVEQIEAVKKARATFGV